MEDHYNQSHPIQNVVKVEWEMGFFCDALNLQQQ